MDDDLTWITPLYTGLLGLLMLVLSYNVSRYRMKLRIVLGDGENVALQRAVRAHANLAEYAPLALVLMAGVELQGFSDGVIHILGVLLVAGRVLHAVGLTRQAGPSMPRAMGISLTWLMIFLASLLSIFSIVSPNRF